PVTNADMAANSIINNYLEATGIPVLSEENKAIPYTERKKWERLWIVDPLDGTKEFLKKNGEFTVNIALVHGLLPVLGVIYAPVTSELYYAIEGKGSFKVNKLSQRESIELIREGGKRLSLDDTRRTGTVAVSRSHMNKKTENYIKSRTGKVGMPALVSRGSSLKICMVAEGTAACYPRFGPTMEWDTAAGHAIVKYAGGSIRRIDNGEELIYNKEDTMNPDFIVE
ncbi:MAG: 3'(2'),5'-bisphosphate nucleotidase CysQ, partial [Bacteroidales bacterium]|nr:3'(2'),5'-bisphosphate nucleotidase CysQ [Bacteroidales bacterium]